MTRGDAPIGVFDSGVGGISVLKRLQEAMPHENFYYYGDSHYNPYGSKTQEEIIARAKTIVDHLLAKNCKAIVIACNTATSAAAHTIRNLYPTVPVIGIEPALKLALEMHPEGRVLVLATPATLSLEKFHTLESALGITANKDQVIHLACAGLASRIEKGELDQPDLVHMLEKLLEPYVGKVTSVVLGCTHYPFIEQYIKRVMGDVAFFDGAHGVAAHTREVLAERQLLSQRTVEGQVVFESSNNTTEQLAVYRRFYELPLI